MDPSRSDASSPPLLADRQLTQHNPPSTVEIESSPLSSDLQFALSLSYYSSLFLTGLASIALIVNLFLLCSSRYLRRPIGVNLRLCVSLTASDALCAFFYILTYIINVLIPPNIFSNCWSLLLEVFKFATFFASVFTLLALALNHYVGIVYPLERHAITPRTVRLAIASAYLVPLVVILGMFCCHPSGFRAKESFAFFSSHGCEEATIMKFPAVRWVLVLPFILTILLLSFLYLHILLHMNRASKDPLLSNTNSSTKRTTNKKLLVTLVLLAGSACLGWLPTTISYLVTCDTCLLPLPLQARLFLNVLTHLLNILKLIVDAFIYSSRLIEIRYAIYFFRDVVKKRVWSMLGFFAAMLGFFAAMLGLKTQSVSVPSEFTRYLTETKEHRSMRRKHATFTVIHKKRSSNTAHSGDRRSFTASPTPPPPSSKRAASVTNASTKASSIGGSS